MVGSYKFKVVAKYYDDSQRNKVVLKTDKSQILDLTIYKAVEITPPVFKDSLVDIGQTATQKVNWTIANESAFG